MKKTLILLTIALGGSAALNAQGTTIDSAGNVITPPPATQTITTTTTISTPPSSTAAPATTPPPPPPAVTATVTSAPAYDAGTRRGINVNRLRFGAFVAPNISWMKPTAATDDGNQFKTENNGSRIGFTYGLMADYFFVQNYGIVTGVSINQTGGKIQATAINSAAGTSKVVKAEFDYSLQYLDIPLALKLRTDNINGFRFFGQLGVSLGINISKKADYKVSYYDAASRLRDTSGTKIKLTGAVTNIAPVMFQMNIGAGAEYPFSNKLTAYFGLFFNNGFAPDATNPDKFDNDKLGYQGSFKDANTRLNNFALRLGLFF